MGCDKLNEDDHRPASVSLQEPQPLALSVSNNGAAENSGMSFAPNTFGADLYSFRHPSLPNGHPHMDQSYMRAPETDKMMAGFLNPNSLQNLYIDPFADKARNNVTKHLRVSEVTNAVAQPVEIYQPTKGSDIFTMIPPNVGSVISSGFQNPLLSMNIMPPGSVTNGGNQMASQGRESENKSVSRLPIDRNPISLGHSVSAMHHAKDIGQKGNTFDVNCPYNELGFSEQFDGSFLTLGTGSNQEADSQFSTREIASQLEEAVQSESKHAHIQNNNRSSPSVGHNWAGNMPSLQSNANGLSSLAFNAGGWDTQLYSSVNSYGNSGYVGKSSVSYSDVFPSRGIQDHQQYPIPLNSNFHSGSTELSGLASGSAIPAWVTPQLLPNHLQNPLAKNDINTSTGSSISFRLPIHRGSQHHNGNLIPPSMGSLTQAFDGHPCLMNTQSVGQLASAYNVDSVQALYSSVPGRTQGQVTGVGSLQPSADASFPKRLGVQPNYAALQAINEGNLHQTQSFAYVQLPRNLEGPAFASDWHQDRSPFQYNVHGSFPVGQSQGSVPVQNSQDLPRANYYSGQEVIHKGIVDASPATSTLIRPSVKRRATAPPHSVASLSQRRKITPQPISTVQLHQSVPAPRPATIPFVATGSVPVRSPAPRSMQVPSAPRSVQVPSAPRSMQVPPAPLYIKSEGIEGPPQPLGHKCLICKRDLSYAPEGPFQQPAIPPPVAVLSCGHTFHDHCLQNITPDDQSKDPPCIPCAIGET